MLNTWTYPDEYAQTDWTYSGGGRWYSSILDALSFRGMDCDIGHCVINAKLRRDHQKVNNNQCRVLHGKILSHATRW